MAGWNGIFYNGIFHYGWDMVTSAGNNSQSFTLNSGNGVVGTTNARYGDGQAFIPFGGGSGMGFNLLVNLNRMISGIYLFVTSLPSSGNAVILYWQDSVAGGTQISLKLSSTGALQFFLSNGSTTVGASSANGVIQANRGSYIQTDVTIGSGTSGSVKCYVDTSGSSPIINSSGVNSQSTTNAFFDQLWLYNPGSIGTYWDDFYALDMTGSAPFNAILGPVHEHYDPPNSDASPNSYSTNPSQPVGNHYQNVDSVTTPSGTAYNYSNTVGQEELYGFPGLSASSVLCMTEWIYDELDAAGTRTVGPVLTSGGTSQTGIPAYTPGSTFAYYHQPYTTDPNNSNNPWSSGTVAAAGSAKMGVTIVS
jgi:hypothetical protein